MKYKQGIGIAGLLVLSLIAALSLGLLDYYFAAKKLMPTFFEIPLSFFLIYGASLLPLMGGAAGADRVIFAERFRENELTRSVFDSDYKYIRRKTDKGIQEMLFDRKADPHEKQDISTKRLDILNQYQKLTSKIIQKAEKNAERMKGKGLGINEYSHKKLKALGYVR